MGYSYCITKTCLYNFDPLKPHFYIVKLGFTRLYIIFRISAQNIDCGYTLEPPRRGGSNKYLYSMFNEYLHSMFIWNFLFFGGKFSVYLNRHVFVMVAYVDAERKPYQTSLLAFVIRTFFECTVPLFFHMRTTRSCVEKNETMYFSKVTFKIVFVSFSEEGKRSMCARKQTEIHNICFPCTSGVPSVPGCFNSLSILKI